MNRCNLNVRAFTGVEIVVYAAVKGFKVSRLVSVPHLCPCDDLVVVVEYSITATVTMESLFDVDDIVVHAVFAVQSERFVFGNALEVDWFLVLDRHPHLLIVPVSGRVSARRIVVRAATAARAARGFRGSTTSSS